MTAPPPPRTWIPLAIVALLLGVYALSARLASNRTSVTYDEPLHLVSAYVIRHENDFRMNPEDPPLFQRWVALALPKSSLHPDYTAPEWNDVISYLPAHWAWVNRTLFPHPDSLPPGVTVDHETVIRAARAMMLVIAVAVGAVTALLASVLARSLGGNNHPLAHHAAATAAVLAAALFAFEPTFLGHGPLVKNDVPLALAFATVSLALALMATRVTPATLALLALAAAAGVTTKFSGLLLGPLIILALLLRAVLPHPWTVLGRHLAHARQRIAAAIAISALCLAVGLLATWAVYGFRYAFSPDPNLRANLEPEVMTARTLIARLNNPTTMPTQLMVDRTPTPFPIEAAVWMSEQRWIPETWAKGFIYTYATTRLRSSFLLNEISESGWWYYFPLTFAFKLPLGLLALLLVTKLVATRWMFHALRSPPPDPAATPRLLAAWPFLVTLTLAAAYLLIAMSGNMNMGIRHLLPMMPMLLAATAAIAAWVWTTAGVKGKTVVAVCLLALATESLAARGRYIAFFNLPSRAYGPHKLLTDSNLDWGQDLPTLVEWQQRNPDIPLALSYFGLATPESYGLRYTPLMGTPFSWVPAQVQPPPQAVVAISATWLQEVYMTPNSRGMYGMFRYLRPREVLSDTIFLFNWPPRREDVLPQPWEIRVRTGDRVEQIPLRSALPTR